MSNKEKEKEKTEKPTAKKINGGARPGAGRKPFTPTASERKQVAAMAGYGVPYEQICCTVRDGIHIETLHKYFKAELTKGKAKANATVGKLLFKKCQAGDTTAMIWWSKSQMGWREKKELDISSTDGSMSPKSPVAVDLTKFEPEQLIELTRNLMAKEPQE